MEPEPELTEEEAVAKAIADSAQEAEEAAAAEERAVADALGVVAAQQAAEAAEAARATAEANAWANNAPWPPDQEEEDRPPPAWFMPLVGMNWQWTGPLLELPAAPQQHRLLRAPGSAGPPRRGPGLHDPRVVFFKKNIVQI